MYGVSAAKMTTIKIAQSSKNLSHANLSILASG